MEHASMASNLRASFEGMPYSFSSDSALFTLYLLALLPFLPVFSAFFLRGCASYLSEVMSACSMSSSSSEVEGSASLGALHAIFDLMHAVVLRQTSTEYYNAPQSGNQGSLCTTRTCGARSRSTLMAINPVSTSFSLSSPYLNTCTGTIVILKHRSMCMCRGAMV